MQPDKVEINTYIYIHVMYFLPFQRMEEMLNGFQSDLSSISTEIQSLQEQSISMNVKLKNRQVPGRLGPVVQN